MSGGRERGPGPDPEWPRIVDVAGAEAGPTVAVLGGVHGDELEGVLAARRLVGLLSAPGGLLRGSVRVAAPAHPAAWAACRRVSPVDGANLARVFPGDATGTATQRLAAALTSQVISGADLLIDLHSAGAGFDMPLLVGYHTGEDDASRRSAAAAAAFGAPLVWEHPQRPPGRSLSAAADLGVPSIYVEGRGGGQVRRRDLDCYVDGVLRVLHGFGMTDAAPAGRPAAVRVRGDGDTDGGITAPVDGYLVTAVEVGDHVPAGAVLGEIVDSDGGPRAVLRAPHAGVVMLLRRPASTTAGDTAAIVATRVEDGVEDGADA